MVNKTNQSVHSGDGNINRDEKLVEGDGTDRHEERFRHHSEQNNSIEVHQKLVVTRKDGDSALIRKTEGPKSLRNGSVFRSFGS